jgi:hypothetical protein
MRHVFALLILLVTSPALAQSPHDWADDGPSRDPFWASRAFTETGTRVRNTPVYRPYSTYRDRYNHYHRHRRHGLHEHAKHYAHEHGKRHHHGPRVASYVQERHGRCGSEVSAVGTEHYSEDEAKRSAIKGWMAEVRHRLGTEMMDINNAENLAFRCVISTPGDRISDKIAQWTRGDLLKECRIVARPCRPEVDHALPAEILKGVRSSTTTGKR